MRYRVFWTAEVEAATPKEAAAQAAELLKEPQQRLHVKIGPADPGEWFKLADVASDEPSIRKRLAALGFQYSMTGGNCTAYIQKLPNGSEAWITDFDGNAPISLDEMCAFCGYPADDQGPLQDNIPWLIWEGPLRDALAMLEPKEDAHGKTA